jgi:hypothetical protein
MLVYLRFVPCPGAVDEGGIKEMTHGKLWKRRTISKSFVNINPFEGGFQKEALPAQGAYGSPVNQ